MKKIVRLREVLSSDVRSRRNAEAVRNEVVNAEVGIFTESLESVTIRRTSIRFVNQFTLPDFNDPSEYFNTVISSNTEDSIPYPLARYGYSLTLDVAEGVYSIINHSVNNVAGKFDCILDIDVLDRNNLIFDLPSINAVLEKLRAVKNNIFFNNLTGKTLDLCD